MMKMDLHRRRSEMLSDSAPSQVRQVHQNTIFPTNVECGGIEKCLENGVYGVPRYTKYTIIAFSVNFPTRAYIKNLWKNTKWCTWCTKDLEYWMKRQMRNKTRLEWCTRFDRQLLRAFNGVYATEVLL